VIVVMSKVEVLGPRRLLEEALGFLQQQGVLQLRGLPDELVAARGGGALLRRVPLSSEQTALLARLEEVERRAGELLAALGNGRADRSPAEPLADLAQLDAIERELQGLGARRAGLEKERDVVARYGRLMTALAPMRAGIPGVATPHTFGVVVKREGDVLDLLAEEIARLTHGAFDLQSAPIDEQHIGVLLSVPESLAREASAFLFEHGVEEVKLPSEYAGRPLAETLALLARREREIPGELATLDRDSLTFSARWSGPLRATLQASRTRIARLRAETQCGETDHAFIVTGWVPRERLGPLANAAEDSFQGAVAIVETPIAAGDEVPVVLRNRPALKPFELLLALVGLPRYGSIDPTPYLAVTFPLFFGLILGDAGFGALGIALALLARRHWRGKALADAAAIALACAISAVLFGVLFGEAFGGLGEHAGMRPILFDRRSAFQALLGLAMTFGALHVALGMALGIFDAIGRRHVREAIGRGARLLMLASACVCALAVASGPRAALLAGLSALGASLIVAVAADGPMALLELVLSLGNVLSYARLMALGLASVLLAEVANGLAATLKPAAIGVALAIVLHAANFALALVSPTIAALRLQYVEFFEKFYEGGGAPYRPFALG
jgi:V/A-type H+-transporting ATPase subunit I